MRSGPFRSLLSSRLFRNIYSPSQTDKQQRTFSTEIFVSLTLADTTRQLTWTWWKHWKKNHRFNSNFWTSYTKTETFRNILRHYFGQQRDRTVVCTTQRGNVKTCFFLLFFSPRTTDFPIYKNARRPNLVAVSRRVMFVFASNHFQPYSTVKRCEFYLRHVLGTRQIGRRYYKTVVSRLNGEGAVNRGVGVERSSPFKTIFHAIATRVRVGKMSERTRFRWFYAVITRQVFG